MPIRASGRSARISSPRAGRDARRRHPSRLGRRAPSGPLFPVPDCSCPHRPRTRHTAPLPSADTFKPLRTDPKISSRAMRVLPFAPVKERWQHEVALGAKSWTAAGMAFTDEGDGLDIGMLGQYLARRLSDALHQIGNTKRQPGLVADRNQEERRQRTPFAGLWSTVQPAAGADAILQEDSMNGVFQPVTTPAGPSGWRNVWFMWSSVGCDRPLPAPGARTATKRKFSAPRMAALLMKRSDCLVSQDSISAISSARDSIASATACTKACRRGSGTCPAVGNRVPARTTPRVRCFSAFPAATMLIGELSIDVVFTEVVPESSATSAPSLKCPGPTYS